MLFRHNINIIDTLYVLFKLFNEQASLKYIGTWNYVQFMIDIKYQGYAARNKV